MSLEILTPEPRRRLRSAMDSIRGSIVYEPFKNADARRASWLLSLRRRIALPASVCAVGSAACAAAPHVAVPA
jgi:hypothetical protein